MEIRKQTSPSPDNGREMNSGVQVTIPDLGMSISEIMEYSLSHSEMLEPIPDIPYGLDLVDLYPNVNEFANTDSEFNEITEDESIQNNLENIKNPPRDNDDRGERVDE